MISLRVLFLVMLAMNELDYVRADHNRWNKFVNFNYKHEDILDIDIMLLNVPPVAKRYAVFVQNVPEPTKTGRIPTDEPIHITKRLDRQSVTLYIELHNSNKICSTKKIMDGVRDEYADVDKFRTACLNKYDNTCSVAVDFENKCNEDNIICTQTNGRLTCESPDGELPEDTVHQWYQVDVYGSVIGTIPTVKGAKTTFKNMGFHKFDLNSLIYSKMSSRQWKNYLHTEVYKLPFTNYNKYEFISSKSYSELEQVNFTCPNNARTQIGWIEPTGENITTYNVTSYSWNFGKTDHSSMLCCLNYNIYTNEHIMTVERTVNDFTLLIYKEPVKQDNANALTPPPPQANIPQETPLTQAITSSPKPVAPNSTTTSGKLQNQQHTDSQSDTDNPPSDKSNYYIGIASAAVIIIMVSVIYAVIKKCCRKSSDPEQTLQLETYATTKMLYAELDIRPGNAPPQERTEDPTYAEIIGVLRPQNENVKN